MTNRERIPEEIRMIRKEKRVFVLGFDNVEEVCTQLMRYDVNIEGYVLPPVKRCGFLEYFVDYWIRYKKKYILKKSHKYIPYDKITWEKGDVLVIALSSTRFKKLRNFLFGLEEPKLLFWNGCGEFMHYNFDLSCFYSKNIFWNDNYYIGMEERGLDYEYYTENISKFEQTYLWLNDEKSKKTMKRYIEGHCFFDAFPFNDGELWKTSDAYNQYFPEDIISLSSNEVFVDCGAYTGDTLSDFISRVTSFDTYYAFEPDKRRIKDIENVLNSYNGQGNIKLVEYGVWDKKTKLSFSVNKDCGEITEENEMLKEQEIIDVNSIDNVVDKLQRVTFIKMDIEGSELKALQGSRGTILRDSPVLAICVYHKKEDLISIPQYIKSLNPNYKLYLRAHYPYCSELVLYAIQ